MPLVSDSLKIIFQHIPKTGGASFRDAMMLSDPNCYNIGTYHSCINRDIIKTYPDYTKITIVRNSYKALVSMYRFTCIRYLKIEPTVIGFKQWLNEYATGKSVTVQSNLILDETGLLVDEIIDYDNLNNRISEINKKLNINLDLKAKHHFYGSYDWRLYYNNETLEIAYNLCKSDIEYFNWKPE